jgi:hypothetical protein
MSSGCQKSFFVSENTPPPSIHRTVSCAGADETTAVWFEYIELGVTLFSYTRGHYETPTEYMNSDRTLQ